MDATTTTSTPPSDSISAHLQTLAEEAEALLKATARAGDEKMQSARTKLADELTQIRLRLVELEQSASEQVKAAAHSTDAAVHQHPYTAMGAAAAIGLLLGFVLGRR